jgi:hypothetical protein
LEGRACEVLKPLDGTIMFASADVFPLNTDPDLSIVLSPLMFELTDIPDNPCTIVEKNSSRNK